MQGTIWGYYGVVWFSHTTSSDREKRKEADVFKSREKAVVLPHAPLHASCQPTPDQAAAVRRRSSDGHRSGLDVAVGGRRRRRRGDGRGEAGKGGEEDGEDLPRAGLGAQGGR